MCLFNEKSSILDYFDLNLDISSVDSYIPALFLFIYGDLNI
jgi:hypothetical protein